MDEALDVLVGLWRGEPFSYSGQHFQIRDVTFLPQPIQQPRIPIWIGGGWYRKGVVHRASKWDGACLYKVTEDSDWSDMTPDDIHEMKSALQLTKVDYDLVAGGRERSDNWDEERQFIRNLADAGVTWWKEAIMSADYQTMYKQISRGPLFIE